MRSLQIIVLATLLGPLASQEPAEEGVRVATWPDGSVRSRTEVDDEGLPHGLLERFREDGSVEVRAHYRHGELDGTWIETDPDGTRRLLETYRKDQLHGRREVFAADGTRRLLENWRDGVRDGKFEEVDAAGRTRDGEYRDGLLHGKLKITQERKTLGRQTWKDGLLVELDRLEPFSRSEAEIHEQLTAILAPPADDAPGAPSDDELAADPKLTARLATLRILQAYRALCGLRWDDMELVAEWNDLCDAASEVCAANGGLSHNPTQPPGFDDARFKQGYEGASKSNLSSGGMLGSVDAYMDDSDPSNIDRIGHRRWCLNPGMKRTAFGEHQRYSAMWSMDGSGKPARDLDAVLYPPPGHVPVDFFGARHAWSIAPLKGKALKADDVRIDIRPLDDWWLPVGDESLQLDHLGVAGGGYGSGPCLVFRPVGLVVRPGARYLVEVRGDTGKTLRWRYVVAFCAPIRSR